GDFVTSKAALAAPTAPASRPFRTAGRTEEFRASSRGCKTSLKYPPPHRSAHRSKWWMNRRPPANLLDTRNTHLPLQTVREYPNRHLARPAPCPEISAAAVGL